MTTFCRMFHQAGELGPLFRTSRLPPESTRMPCRTMAWTVRAKALTIQATAGTRYSHSTRRSHGEAGLPSGKIRMATPISTMTMAQPGWASIATQPSGSVPWRTR